MKPRIIIAKILLLSLFAQTANAAEALPVIYAQISTISKTLKGRIDKIRNGENKGGKQYTTAIHYCVGVEGGIASGIMSWGASVSGKDEDLKKLVLKINNSEKDVNTYEQIMSEANNKTVELENASKSINLNGVDIDTGAVCKFKGKVDEYSSTITTQSKIINDKVISILQNDLDNPENVSDRKRLVSTLGQYPKCKVYLNEIQKGFTDTKNYLILVKKYKSELDARAVTMYELKQKLAKADCSGKPATQDPKVVQGKPDISGTDKKAEKPAVAAKSESPKTTNEDEVPASIKDGDLTGKPDPKTASGEPSKNGTKINPDEVSGNEEAQSEQASLNDSEMTRLEDQARARDAADQQAQNEQKNKVVKNDAKNSNDSIITPDEGGESQPVVTQAPKPAPPPPPQPEAQPPSEQKVATETAPPIPKSQQVVENPPPASQTNQQQTPDTPAPQQQSSSGWGTALAVGGGVLVLGALGAGGYYLYQQSQDNDDKNKDKKSSSNVALASTNPDNSSSASVGANQEVVAAVNEEAQKAQSGLMAAKSKQEYQDIAAGFANSAAGKLAAIGIVTQIETYTSSTGFSRAGLRLINTSNAEGEATAKSLFSAGVYDPLAGVEPAI